MLPHDAACCANTGYIKQDDSCQCPSIPLVYVLRRFRALLRQALEEAEAALDIMGDPVFVYHREPQIFSEVRPAAPTRSKKNADNLSEHESDTTAIPFHRRSRIEDNLSHIINPADGSWFSGGCLSRRTAAWQPCTTANSTKKNRLSNKGLRRRTRSREHGEIEDDCIVPTYSPVALNNDKNRIRLAAKAGSALCCSYNHVDGDNNSESSREKELACNRRRRRYHAAIMSGSVGMASYGDPSVSSPVPKVGTTAQDKSPVPPVLTDLRYEVIATKV